MQKDVAEAVARHLVAAGTLVDEDPAAALAHARYARRRASRIAVVREAAGITAYHAGEWAEALAELRAARRMGGGPGHLAVMADIERAMERPERAIELSRSPEARELERSAQIELAIVVAGARRDLGELDAAVIALQVPELEASRRDPWSARLFYAYADNLLAAGRESDALQWFVHAADADTDGETDADARIADLTGEPLADEGIEFGLDDERPSDDPAEGLADTTADTGDVTADAAAPPNAVDGDAADGPADEVATDPVVDQPDRPAAGDATEPTSAVDGDEADGPVEAATDDAVDPADHNAADDVTASAAAPTSAVDGDAAGRLADEAATDAVVDQPDHHAANDIASAAPTNAIDGVAAGGPADGAAATDDAVGQPDRPAAGDVAAAEPTSATDGDAAGGAVDESTGRGADDTAHAAHGAGGHAESTADAAEGDVETAAERATTGPADQDGSAPATNGHVTTDAVAAQNEAERR